jgi:chemotaxis protein CheC
VEQDSLRIDALTELINIGLGRAASILSTMTSEAVQLTVPRVLIMEISEIWKSMDIEPGSTAADVRQSFHGALIGSADLLFPRKSAAALVNAVTGEADDDDDLDELRVATLSEVGNIVINGAMGSLTNILNAPVQYDVPLYREKSLMKMFSNLDEDSAHECILVDARFTIQSIEISGDILLIFDVASQANLWAGVDKLISQAG